MKKIILTISAIICFGFYAIAQSDGFFNDCRDFENIRDGKDAYGLPALPDQHGYDDDVNDSPLGSGLLILTALGAGYAVMKKKRD